MVVTRENGYKAVRYEKIIALLIEANKELLLRRMQTLEGLLKRTRVYLSENRVQDAKKVIEQILELRQDMESIVEREN